MAPRDAIFPMTGDKSTATETPARRAMRRLEPNYEADEMAARYSKVFMPLREVKEKEFLSRPMGCKGIGFSFVRCKPGRGCDLRAPPQSAGRGIYRTQRRRYDYPRRQTHQDAARNHRPGRSDRMARLGKRLKERRCLYGAGGYSPEKVSARRTHSVGRRDSQSKKDSTLEEGIAGVAYEKLEAQRMAFRRCIGLGNLGRPKHSCSCPIAFVMRRRL